MNWAPVVGLLLALVMMSAVVGFTIDSPLALVDPVGVIIVIVGTISATLISFPFRSLKSLFPIIVAFFRNEELYKGTDLEELVDVTAKMRKGSIQEVERVVDSVRNPFLKFGVQLVVDGAGKNEIEDILSFQIEKLRRKEDAEAMIFRAMANYAPAFGMLGTLMGLINMLVGLTEDVSQIGANLSIAMMTTLYGLLLANMLFRPIATRWEARTEERVAAMRLIVDAVVMLRRNVAPGSMRDHMTRLTKEVL